MGSPTIVTKLAPIASRSLPTDQTTMAHALRAHVFSRMRDRGIAYRLLPFLGPRPCLSRRSRKLGASERLVGEPLVDNRAERRDKPCAVRAPALVEPERLLVEVPEQVE